MQAKKTTKPAHPDFLPLINAIKLIFNIETDTELAKIIKVSQQAISKRKEFPPPLPQKWQQELRNHGVDLQHVEWLGSFAKNKARTTGYITKESHADEWDNFFAEIRGWWKTTRDPSLSAFVLSFSAAFPDFPQWKERQPDIKNVEERGDRLEITESA